MRSSVYQNRGILLLAVAMVSTLWLASTEQLSLYIHPRYNVFSICMSILGLVVILFAIQTQPPKAKHKPMGVYLLIAVAFVTLLIIKPATLTSSTASQRGINTAANTDSLAKLANSNVVSPFGNQNLQLNVKEWAGLLTQTNDKSFFTNRTVDVEGFVTADESGNPDIFYVSRFIVSCCAVDARPVGIPVHKPGWQSDYPLDQWVHVQGTFVYDTQRTVVQPTQINSIDQPKDPYVY